MPCSIARKDTLPEYLPRAIKDGNDLEARTRVAFGNTLSGGVMCLTLITSEHALEHALSAYHPNLPHGAGLIMVSRAYYKYFIEHHACDDRFIRMAQAMGMPEATKPEDFLTALTRLQEACGVADLKMSDYGITPDEFETLMRNTREVMGHWEQRGKHFSIRIDVVPAGESASPSGLALSTTW